jgi:septum formation protein
MENGQMENRQINNGQFELILGSASPRRRELLSRFVAPELIRIVPADLDEASLIAQLINKSPNARFGLSSNWAARIAQQLAEAKMDALAIAASSVAPIDRVAVTADTVVVLGDQILGKPSGEEDARAMLSQLAGRDHAVVTGLCVEARINGQIQRFMAAEMTTVTFASLTDEKINWYIGTDEPFDKAGSYGIQGYGSALVKSINGCYYNVMGLPIFRLLEVFEQVQAAFPSVRDQIKLLPW